MVVIAAYYNFIAARYLYYYRRKLGSCSAYLFPFLIITNDKTRKKTRNSSCY